MFKWHDLPRRTFVKMGLQAGMIGISSCSKPGQSDSEPSASDRIRTIYSPTTIVGSGFGGAVAAEKMTRAGHQVLMLERGRRWDDVQDQPNPFSALFPPDGRSTWLRNRTILPAGPRMPIRKYAGVLDRVDFPDIQIYRGAGYGGGSLVYSAVMVEPQEKIFQKDFGAYVDVEKFYDIYFPRARQGTGTTPMPEDIRTYNPYQAMSVFQKEALAARLDLAEHQGAINWNQLRRELNDEIPRSLAYGFTNYGNAHGSKLSLDYTYLKRAEETGRLNVLPLHIVKSINENKSGGYLIEIERISLRGRIEERIMLITDALVLSAGSLGTTELLLRAKTQGTLPKLSNQIGQSWGNNGFVLFGRSNVSEATGKSQGAPGIYGINTSLPNTVDSFIEFAQTPSVSDGKSMLYAALTDINFRGSVSYDQDKDSILIHFPDEGKVQAVEACQAVMKKLIAANGGVLTDNLITKGYNTQVTYHPVGGCSLGQVTDPYGRVEGYNKLYITDTSLFPGTGSCANPALTAAALAEWCMDHVLEDFDQV